MKRCAACLLFLSLILNAVVAAATPGAGAGLDGLWKGALKVPGGQLEVIFRLVKLSNGGYYGTLDVPLQRVAHMAVSVDLHGDTISLFAEEAASRFTGQINIDGKMLAGIWKQPGYQVAMQLQHAPAVNAPGGKVRLSPPYREEEVAFSAGRTERLGGLLTVPAGPGPFPAVVLAADAGATDRDATVGEYRPLGALADYLTRRGIAVLRLDGLPVDPAPALPQRVADIQAALNYLRTRPDVDFSRLGVVGHGEGGNAALLAAAQPLAPAFVVTMAAPGLSGKALALAQQTAVLRAMGTAPALIEASLLHQRNLFDVIETVPDAAQAQAMVVNMLRQRNPAMDTATALASATQLTSAHYRHFLAFDPMEKLSQVTCPVLLLNGDADLHVAPEPNLSALAKGLRGNKRVSTKKLPGVNHLFQADPQQWPLVNGQPRETFSPQTQEIVRAWILQQGKE